MFRGGYPPLSDEPPADPVRWLNAYVRTYVERDVRMALNVRDLPTFQRFLGLCAGTAAQMLNTVRLGGDSGVSHNTVRAWLGVLEAGFLLFRLQPHTEGFRKRLVRMPRLYFHDTGLLVRLLGVQTKEQLYTHPLRGALFENWVLTELRKAYLNRGEVDFLRDTGTVLDAWECKSGTTFSPDWTDGLHYWAKLAGKRAGQLHLVYGGSESFIFKDVRVLSWTDVADCL